MLDGDDTQIPDSDDLYSDWASVSGASMGSSQVELDFENDDDEDMTDSQFVAAGQGKFVAARTRTDAWVVLNDDL